MSKVQSPKKRVNILRYAHWADAPLQIGDYSVLGKLIVNQSIRKFMKKTFLFIFIFLIHGCTSGPMFSSAPPTPEGKALIYFMYTNTFGGVMYIPQGICIDQTEVSSLHGNTYSWLYVDPGIHRFSLAYTLFGCPENDVTTEELLIFSNRIESGKEYYVDFEIIGEGYGVIRSSLGFKSQEISKEKIKGYRFVEQH